MNQVELETVYDAMAVAIDEVGQMSRELYLAKLALALANSLGDAQGCLQLIETCKANLPEASVD